MTIILTPLTIEQRVSTALSIYDPILVREVVTVMRDEVFMMTLDDIDPVILRMGAEQAHAIVYGRVIRPYVAVEYAPSARSLLCPDGCFATAPERPARYATESAALRAAEQASNRRCGGVVGALSKPYLPIA